MRTLTYDSWLAEHFPTVDPNKAACCLRDRIRELECLDATADRIWEVVVYANFCPAAGFIELGDLLIESVEAMAAKEQSLLAEQVRKYTRRSDETDGQRWWLAGRLPIDSN